MKAWQIVLIVLGCFLLVVLMAGGCCVAKYNSIIMSRNAATGQWSQVENVYQRRADLIPNIVEAVKAEKNFEQSTLENVTKARASVGQIKIDPTNLTPEALAAFQQTQQGLAGALQRLMVISENYPNLRTNAAFSEARTTFEGTENRCAVERREFNIKAVDYNNNIQTAFGRFICLFFPFKEMATFKAEAGAEKAPKANFGEEKK